MPRPWLRTITRVRHADRVSAVAARPARRLGCGAAAGSQAGRTVTATHGSGPGCPGGETWTLPSTAEPGVLLGPAGLHLDPHEQQRGCAGDSDGGTLRQEPRRDAGGRGMRREAATRRSDRGASLVELTVAMAIAVVLLTGLSAIFIGMLGAVRTVTVTMLDPARPADRGRGRHAHAACGVPAAGNAGEPGERAGDRDAHCPVVLRPAQPHRRGLGDPAGSDARRIRVGRDVLQRGPDAGAGPRLPARGRPLVRLGHGAHGQVPAPHDPAPVVHLLPPGARST